MFKLSAFTQESSLDTCADLLYDIYRENPKYWPHGLSVSHHDDLYLVREKQSNTPVGFVGWQKISNNVGDLIGYYTIGMRSGYRGKGLAKEALEKMLKEKSPEVKEVRAYIVDTNGPSIGLAKSMGIPVQLKSAAAFLDNMRSQLSGLSDRATQLKADSTAETQKQVADQSAEAAEKAKADDKRLELEQKEKARQEDMARKDREHQEKLEQNERFRQEDQERAQIEQEHEDRTKRVYDALDQNRKQQEVKKEEAAESQENTLPSGQMAAPSSLTGDSPTPDGTTKKMPENKIYKEVSTGYNYNSATSGSDGPYSSPNEKEAWVRKHANKMELVKKLLYPLIGGGSAYGLSKATEGGLSEEARHLQMPLNVPAGLIAGLMSINPKTRGMGLGLGAGIPLKDVGLFGVDALKDVAESGRQISDQIEPTISKLEEASRVLPGAAKSLSEGAEAFSEGMERSNEGLSTNQMVTALGASGLGLLGAKSLYDLVKDMKKKKRKPSTSVSRPRRKGRVKIEVDPTPELMQLIGGDIAQLQAGDETHVGDKALTFYNKPKAAKWFKTSTNFTPASLEQGLESYEDIKKKMGDPDFFSSKNIANLAAQGLPMAANAMFFEPYVKPLIDQFGLGTPTIQESMRVRPEFQKLTGNPVMNQAQREWTRNFVNRARAQNFG